MRKNGETSLMSTSRLRLLLVGPLPPPIGGTTVLFALLVDELSNYEGIEVKVVDISRGSYENRIGSYIKTGLRVTFEVGRAATKADVISFHCSETSAIIFSPVIHLISKLYNKPWIFRKFGGTFDVVYDRLSTLAKVIVDHTTLSADLCLYETKKITKYFKPLSKNAVEWFPNCRPLHTDITSNVQRIRCQRFIFCSHVAPDKGILELIEAGEQMHHPIIVDVYGPFRCGIQEDIFKGLNIVRYKGVLRPEEVSSTLKNYDAMILPTYHVGEGYPGIILESYTVGIPVITSRWNAIHEIVDNTSGILIEPKNSEELRSAMQRMVMDSNLYQALCLGTAVKREQFSSKVWTSKFVDHCVMLHKNRSCEVG